MDEMTFEFIDSLIEKYTHRLKSGTIPNELSSAYIEFIEDLNGLSERILEDYDRGLAKEHLVDEY